MSKIKQVVISNKNQILLAQAKWCNDFMSNLRGFTFKRDLTTTEGLVLVQKSDSIANTSIHMLFVFFDLGVIWVNDAGQVVDTVVAKAWRPFYAPSVPARYTIECHPNLLSQVEIGDQITFQ